ALVQLRDHFEEPRIHLVVERVVPVGAVQRHDGDRSVDGQRDRVRGHPLNRSTRSRFWIFPAGLRGTASTTSSRSGSFRFDSPFSSSNEHTSSSLGALYYAAHS